MKEENRMQMWLNTAVSGIRFKPDREAVEEELRGHFEDKVADLQRIFHISQEEAEEMALGQMGDAEEIGREMAEIHKPWLGWLWQASQAALLLSVILWLLSCVYHGEPLPLRHGEEPEWPSFSCAEELELGQYKFRVKEAWLEQDDGAWELNVEWKVTSLRFWEPIGHIQSYFWSAEDDLGNEYCTYADRYYGNYDGIRVASDMAEQDGLGWTVLQTVPQVPENAQWVKLSYDHAGERGSVLLEREVAE